jgi:hypothetical protein
MKKAYIVAVALAIGKGGNKNIVAKPGLIRRELLSGIEK